jgi:hypothetical protein
MNVLIIGHKSHGKDEVGARLARLLKCKYLSSSLFMCEKAVLPTLAPLYGYTTVADCYADRNNHREEWFNLIYAYNADAPTRTADELLKEASIYVGMRNRIEFNANMDKRNFDVVLWVEAGKRKEKEAYESMELTEEDADYVVDNNGTTDDLHAQLVYYASLIRIAGTSPDKSTRGDLLPLRCLAQIV